MGKVKFEIGAEMDLVSPHDLGRALDRYRAQSEAAEREALRGIKPRRIPPMYGAASGGALDMGGDLPWLPTPLSANPTVGTPLGPAEGYAWMIRLLSMGGLTFGTTPDIVNMYIYGQSSRNVWWQFNGNNFAYTFGRGELWLSPGERLHFVSVGTFAATGQISVVGNVEQVPAEMLGKLK